MIWSLTLKVLYHACFIQFVFDDYYISDAFFVVTFQMPQEVYFLSTEKYRPMIFGLPLIIPCNENTTYQDIYQAVWTQVSRLVSPLPPRDSSQNHATDW